MKRKITQAARFKTENMHQSAELVSKIRAVKTFATNCDLVGGEIPIATKFDVHRKVCRFFDQYQFGRENM